MDIVIIEDEQLAADKLAQLILACEPDYRIVQKIRSVESAISFFTEHHTSDLVFLDIHLLDGNCFDILDHAEISCPVIFTTAYDKYALQAFQLHSVDYLLKPISLQRVEKALVKLKNMKLAYSSIDSEGIKHVVSQLLPNPVTYKTRFAIKAGDQLLSIPVEDIRQVFSEDRISFIVTITGEKYAIDHSLNELEHLLDPQAFFRVNRQKIIHIKNIKAVYRYFKGRLKIDLFQLPKESVLVSSRRVSDFQSWLDQ